MSLLRRLRSGAGLMGVLAMLLTACQQTPRPPSPVADMPRAPSAPAAIPPAPPSEIATLPPPAPPTPPPTSPIPPTVTAPAIPVLPPESTAGAPDTDRASRQIEYNTTTIARPFAASAGVAWYFRRTTAGQIVGFEFSNHGGNRILPPRRDGSKNQLYTRDFQFHFDGRARQDIHLMVTDWAPARDRQFRHSDLMHTLMHFFPRRVLPAIVDAGDTHRVTLPTGEEVTFNARTHEIVGGELTESVVDLNPDRQARKYPGVSYGGKGVVVRANARGSDPRLSATAIITTGSPASACDKGPGCSRCQVPARELWDQSGAVRFKFVSDQEFDRYLIARCRFGLPKDDRG